MRYVIIGGSIAGISAAKSIRGYDRNAEITVISEERTRPYYRPMISAVIEKKDLDIALTGNSFEILSIRALYGRAIGIDVRSKSVSLSTGGHLNYDKLLIATGCNAVIPDVPGITGPDIFPLRTINDALNIQKAARDGKRAVVLGGGFVGIKAAIALKRVGLQITIIEKLDRILYEKLDSRGSAIVSSLLKRENIDIVTNQSNYEIIRHGAAIHSVRLASGRIIDADLVVVSVGTKPNIEACAGSGIKINKGIVIKESLETSVPDVYAAGDVVECRDVVSNTCCLSATWANAEEMGRLAGRNMAGGNIRFTGFLALMNTIELLNTPVTTMGLIKPESAGYDIFAEGSGDSYRKLVFKNDVMVGALFIGQAEETDAYACLIKYQVPVGKLKEPALRGRLGNISLVKPLGAFKS